MTYWHEIDSPVGALMLVGTARTLARIHFQAGPHPLQPGKGWQPSAQAFVQVQAQLMEYFCGARRSFDLPIAPEGTSFQLRVWQALAAIPYGETVAYGELARRLGLSRGARCGTRKRRESAADRRALSSGHWR